MSCLHPAPVYGLTPAEAARHWLAVAHLAGGELPAAPALPGSIDRSSLFRIALQVRSSASGEQWTVRRFAKEHGISTTFLYQLLLGNATSARIEKAIGDFISANLSSLFHHLQTT